MEDRDDGIGSEINTPRDVEQTEESRATAAIQENGFHEVGHLIASYPPVQPSAQPSTSTPIRPTVGRLTHQNISGISPIRENESGAHENGDGLAAGGDGGDDGGGTVRKEYTKLDLAVMLRDKQLEFIHLSEENERLSKMLEKFDDENRNFRNQVTAIKLYAASLAEENEKLKKAFEEKEMKYAECQSNLQLAKQKIALWENVTIEVEADKLSDPEILRKLQDENAELKQKISELKLESEIGKEGEKNAEIWKNKCLAAEKSVEKALKAKGDLEKELESKQVEIDELKSASNDDDNEEHSKLKKFYEENVGKVDKLQNQLRVVEERLEQLQQQDLEVQQLKNQKKEWEKERERLQKRVEELALTNFALTTEKQSLLEADNKGLKDIVAWQEKNKKLTVQNAQLADEMKKFRDIESRLTECLDEMARKDASIKELNEKITESNNDAKRLRDETVYLRAQLNEKTKTMGKESNEPNWSIEKQKLLTECKRLEDEVAKTRLLMDQIEDEKRKNGELAALLEKREVELDNIRDLLEEKRERIEDLVEENTVLKRENTQLKTGMDELSAEYRNFRMQAEVQYQAETEQLNQIIQEKDERLERLHARIALYESYPGQSTVSADSADSKIAGNITVWDALPETIRLELNELKEKYQDLNGLVHKMMQDAPAKPYVAASKVVENKSTDCTGLARSVQRSSQSGSERRSESRHTPGPAIYDPGSSIETSSESLSTTLHAEAACGIMDSCNALLIAIMGCIRHAEIRGKLSPNIQQLLEHLLADIQESDKSSERIKEAVNRFFANLDMALRQTLSASDGNRIRCEKLEKMYREVTADFHSAEGKLNAAQNKCSMYEANVDCLKSQLKSERRTADELHGKLKRAFEEIDNLSKQKDDLSSALSEAKLMLGRKTNLGFQAAGTIKCMQDELQEAKKSEDQMNERYRALCREREKVKRLLSERELDIVKLECRLTDITNECTQRACELQRAENKIDELQRRNDFLKRKYDKREGFLEEMEALLRAMKIRCDSLREANQLRQHLIEKLKKLLAKLGFNLDDPQLLKHKHVSSSASRTAAPAVNSAKKCRAHPRSPHLERLKFSKLAERLKKDAARIEELEKCREHDVVHIPSWRSLNMSASVSSCGSRAEEGRSTSAASAGRTSRTASENAFGVL